MKLEFSGVREAATGSLSTSSPRDPILVIGAGPAGLAAAITCALSGLEVTLVERQPFPRYRPGETLHPGIEPLLDQLGVGDRVRSAGFVRHRGIELEWEGRRRIEEFSNGWLGFQAKGGELDALLLARAVELGVRVCQPASAESPVRAGERVVGAIVGGRPQPASFLIDATGGPRGLLRTSLRLATRTDSPPLVALFGYARGQCSVHESYPLFRQQRDGWVWIAKLGPGLYQWTRLVPPAEKFDRTWVPDELKGLERIGAPRAADLTWRLTHCAAGPGYFLVGDAAAVLDPASSHGVLRAMMSGIMAAHLVLCVRSGRTSGAEAADCYCRWLTDWYVRDVNKLRRSYRNTALLRGSPQPKPA
jgi:flavin-dependent dehydrogenase